MSDTINTIIFWLSYGVGCLAIVAGLLYFAMWLIGQILKLLGYYKMFYKVMMRMARDGEFKKKV